MLPSPPLLFGPINIASVAARPNQTIIASVAVWPNQAIIALPETEAPHLGVSSGGVEVEGVFAKFAGKHLGIEQLGMANSNSMFPEPFNAGQLHGDMPAISTEYEHAFPQPHP